MRSVVAKVKAADADIGSNAEMDYRIMDSDGPGMFNITTDEDTQDGVIILLKVIYVQRSEPVPMCTFLILIFCFHDALDVVIRVTFLCCSALEKKEQSLYSTQLTILIVVPHSDKHPPTRTSPSGLEKPREPLQMLGEHGSINSLHCRGAALSLDATSSGT